MTIGAFTMPSLSGSEWTDTKCALVPSPMLSCWGAQSWVGIASLPEHSWAVADARLNGRSVVAPLRPTGQACLKLDAWASNPLTPR